ncbi:MAG: DoxX family protein [Actinomycetota bacterium]|nr:MAG: DoxX family protein [Actinomycetota bacterium]
MIEIDIAAVLIRAIIGVVMIAHGWNHLARGGKISGTARWFGSIGLRQPLGQAWMSVITEIVGGVLLLLGLITSVAAAGVVGVMAVAGLAYHRGRGFFIVKEGWEYVLTLAVVASALGALGPGRLSLDHAIGIDTALDGWVGLAVAAGGGLLGALALLAVFWRPPRVTS